MLPNVYLLLIIFCYSERPDAEVSALDVLLSNELWTDAISLTAESCKEVCKYAWDGSEGPSGAICSILSLSIEG